MAWEQNPYAVKISLVASEDLSASQFRFVKLSSAINGTPGCAAVSSSNDYAIGILQNSPKPVATSISSSGTTLYNYGEAEVTISGVCKVASGATSGAAISIGSRISVDGSGRAVPVTPLGTTAVKASYIFGTALSASSSTSDIITMVVSTTAAVLGAA
jgi:hypothetical protein